MTPRRRLAPVALVVAACFGCATARRPTADDVGLAGSKPARVALLEPELELWMEGTRDVDPRESSRALDDSRGALAAALDGRGLDGVDAPDALLRVRARAVARTSERRSAQVWSAVAIVAVVAIVVIAIVASRDHGSHHHAASQRMLPAPVAGTPGPWRGRRAYAGYPPSFFWAFSIGVHVGGPVGPSPYAMAGDPGFRLHDPLLEDRGWFDADEVELTAELVDPDSGAVRWRRAVREGVDPRDPRAMERLVDRVLEGQDFGRRGAPRPPPAPARADPSPPPVRDLPEADL